MKIGEQGEPSLKKEIGLFQAVMYGIGLILGAGIYVLIGDIAGMAGNAMWISFAIAAAIAIFTGFSYAELSSIFPKSAAEYVFVRNAFKNNLLAFVAGWLIIFVAIASSAAVALGFSGYLGSFFPQLDPVISAIVLVVILSGVNFVGIKESVWMNTTFTFIELGGLALVIAAAVIFGSFSEVDYYALPLSPGATFPQTVGALLAAAGLVFFAYFGFENLANISEEAKNAKRTIPRALIISIIATTGIYILVSVSAVALVSWEELSSTDAPLAVAAERAFGRAGVMALTAIALFATSNTVLMMLVAGSRIIYGMSRERALPGSLGRIHRSTGTPWVSVLVVMAVVVILLAFSRGNIVDIANIAVFVIFIVYVFVNLALIWLRLKQPDLARGFRSPLSIGRLPVLAALGFLTTLAMLTQFDTITALQGLAVVGIGFAGYAVTGRHRIRNAGGKNEMAS